MRKISGLLLLVISLLGLLRFQPASPRSGREEQQGMPLVPVERPPSRTREGAPTSLGTITELSRKTLLSAAERATFLSLLADPVLQNSIFQGLEKSSEESFDAQEERQRMQLVALFHLMIRERDLRGRRELLQQAADFVRKIDLIHVPELKQKQSLLGDITEILEVLREQEPELFLELAQDIEASAQKPLLHALRIARTQRLSDLSK